MTLGLALSSRLHEPCCVTVRYFRDGGIVGEGRPAFEKGLSGISEREERFLANLRVLDDRFLQYEYLMSFISELDEIPECDRADELIVKGCNGQAWLEVSDAGGCLAMRGSADALVIKSLIGVLSHLLNGRSFREICEWEPVLAKDPVFREQFTVDRQHGFESMLESIRSFSEERRAQGALPLAALDDRPDRFEAASPDAFALSKVGSSSS